MDPPLWTQLPNLNPHSPGSLVTLHVYRLPQEPSVHVMFFPLASPCPYLPYCFRQLPLLPGPSPPGIPSPPCSFLIPWQELPQCNPDLRCLPSRHRSPHRDPLTFVISPRTLQPLPVSQRTHCPCLFSKSLKPPPHPPARCAMTGTGLGGSESCSVWEEEGS